jgi:hypothetical protein
MPSSAPSIASSAVGSRSHVRELPSPEPTSGLWLVLLGPLTIALTAAVVAYLSHLSF